MKNILIVAAENSAEKYGAQIVDQFNKHHPSIHFFGVGGDRFKKRGVEIVVHNKELAIVGIIEVLSSLIKLKRYMGQLVKMAIERQVDAVILIDYPDFNLRLAKKMTSIGIPVYYYISPTLWAWRYSRIKLIKKYVTHMFIIFPFEVDIFEKERIPYTFTGHPLLSSIQVSQSRDQFRELKKIGKSEVLITLLPGSRRSEINFLLPEMLRAMNQLKKELRIKIFLLRAENIEEELISSHLEAANVEVGIVHQEDGYNLINASDMVLTTCGTSNLEIAILGIPFVAVYRVNRLSYLLGKKFVKINLYSIVNILAGKEVVKELIQSNFTAENICYEMKKILNNSQNQLKMKREFKKIEVMMAKDQNPPEIIHNKIIHDLMPGSDD